MRSHLYILDDQVGFLLRRANQRHLGIFGDKIPDLTPMQFAALAKLYQKAPLSQNHLGRETAMDAATIKGVIGRLVDRGMVETSAHPADRRRVLLNLSEAGRAQMHDLLDRATEITEETLEPLTQAERKRFLTLLEKLT